MANKDVDNERFEVLIENICNKNHEYPFLKSFAYSLMSAKKSQRTIYYYLVHVTGFLKETNKPINEITLDDYNAYMIKYKKQSSQSQIVKYSAIKKLAKYLFVTERIPKDFMEYADRPKYIETQQQVQKREKGFLTVNEIQMVINNIQHGIKNGKILWRQDDYRSRDMSIVLLFLSTGMRTIALENLNVEDLDLENNTVIVTDKEDKVNLHQIPEETKIVLEKWLIMREALLKEAGITNEHALFINRFKKRLRYTGIKEIVCKYCNSITDKRITPHKLRATYGTILYNKTHDIEFVRKQMNHANIATTQRYIRGTGKADRQKSADIMSSIISNKKEQPEDLFSTGDSKNES